MYKFFGVVAIISSNFFCLTGASNAEPQVHKDKKTKMEAYVIDGQWNSKNGEILTLETASDGTVSGSFYVVEAKFKQCLGQALPVTGFANNNSMALSINFFSCGADYSVNMVANISNDGHMHATFISRSVNHEKLNAYMITEQNFEKLEGKIDDTIEDSKVQKQNKLSEKHKDSKKNEEKDKRVSHLETHKN